MAQTQGIGKRYLNLKGKFLCQRFFLKLKALPVIKRYDGNPILSMKDIPYEATCIYNAGITKYQGKYVMVFRNDARTNVHSRMSCNG